MDNYLRRCPECSWAMRRDDVMCEGCGALVGMEVSPEASVGMTLLVMGCITVGLAGLIVFLT